MPQEVFIVLNFSVLFLFYEEIAVFLFEKKFCGAGRQNEPIANRRCNVSLSELVVIPIFRILKICRHESRRKRVFSYIPSGW